MLILKRKEVVLRIDAEVVLRLDVVAEQKLDVGDALKLDAEVVLKPGKEVERNIIEELREERLEREIDKIFNIIKNYLTRFTNYLIF